MNSGANRSSEGPANDGRRNDVLPPEVGETMRIIIRAVEEAVRRDPEGVRARLAALGAEANQEAEARLLATIDAVKELEAEFGGPVPLDLARPLQEG